MNAKQQTVSALQMAALFLTYVTGSAIIFIPGQLAAAAGNAAWISLLLAYGMGALLLAAVLYLFHWSQGEGWVGILRQTVGNGVASVLLIPFAAGVFWQLAAIVIEIGSFFKSTMMKDTPTAVTQTLFFLIAALTARAGIEVMARMFTLLLIFMFLFAIVVMLLASPLFHTEYLLPVLPDGIKPVLHGTYIAFGFPYAEVILFSLLLPFTRRKEAGSLGKFFQLALLINGLTLCMSIVCTFMVLGPLSGHLNYSLFQLARLISIQDILERVESVIGFSLIIGVYMKATIVLFMLSQLLSEWFKLNNTRLLICPVALIGLLLSITMYPNQITYFSDGYTLWTIIDSAVYVCPLLLAFAFSLFRGKPGKSPAAK
ncbi:GerAB/ArcD/ProY family transporter [Paenibacillus sp. CAU 1782]